MFQQIETKNERNIKKSPQKINPPNQQLFHQFHHHHSFSQNSSEKKSEVFRRHSYQPPSILLKNTPTITSSINNDIDHKKNNVNNSWNDMFQKLSTDLSQISGRKNEDNSFKSSSQKRSSAKKKLSIYHAKCESCKSALEETLLNDKSLKCQHSNKDVTMLERNKENDDSKKESKSRDGGIVKDDTCASIKNDFDSFFNENVGVISNSFLFNSTPASKRFLLLSPCKRASVNLVKVDSEMKEFFDLTDDEESINGGENVLNGVCEIDSFWDSSEKCISTKVETFRNEINDCCGKKESSSNQCSLEIGESCVFEREYADKNIKGKSEVNEQAANIEDSTITSVNNINLDNKNKINTLEQSIDSRAMENKSISQIEKDFLFGFHRSHLVKLKVRHEETNSSLNKNLSLLLNSQLVKNTENKKNKAKINIKGEIKHVLNFPKNSISPIDSSFLHPFRRCSGGEDASSFCSPVSSFVSSSPLETEDKLSLDLMDINPYVIGVSFNKQSKLLSAFISRPSIPCDKSLNLLHSEKGSLKHLKNDKLEPELSSKNLHPLKITNNLESKSQSSNLKDSQQFSTHITGTKELHVKQLDTVQGDLICCIEEGILYVREVPKDNTNQQSYINSTTYLPTLIDDMVSSKIYITLFIPEAYRQHVVLKRIDEVLHICAFPAGESPDLRVRNLSGGICLKNPSSNHPLSLPLREALVSDKPTFVNSRQVHQGSNQPIFKVFFKLPSHTINRSIEAVMTSWGQLVVIGMTCASLRRMTCNF